MLKDWLFRNKVNRLTNALRPYLGQGGHFAEGLKTLTILPGNLQSYLVMDINVFYEHAYDHSQKIVWGPPHLPGGPPAPLRACLEGARSVQRVMSGEGVLLVLVVGAGDPPDGRFGAVETAVDMTVSSEGHVLTVARNIHNRPTSDWRHDAITKSLVERTAELITLDEAIEGVGSDKHFIAPASLLLLERSK